MSYYPPQQSYGGPPQGQLPPQGYGQQPPYGGGYGNGPPQGQYPPQQGYPPNSSYPQQPYYGQQQNYPPPGQAPYGGPPPSQNQYAQPQGYGGRPPSQNQYAQPQGYGAPQGQYGAQGGAPYGQQFGPPNPPSLGYDPNVHAQIDMTADADALRKAMKGFGTDEKTLIAILTRLDPIQAVHLRHTFNQRFHGRDLEKDIRSETSSWFETGLIALVRGPLENDVHAIHEAIRGMGTNEDLLNDSLLSRSNADLRAIKDAYRNTYHRSLEEDVNGELSLKTKRHFQMVLAANRAEDSVPVNPQEVERDVMEIYKATEGKLGTDELLVCTILTNRNDNQIRAIAQSYEAQFRVNLEHVIRKEFRGHMESALLMQLKGATNRCLRDAELLEAAMAGIGTKDRLLITRLVRFHWDRNYMGMVRQAYQQHYNRDLGSRIKGETSGDYEKLCLALING